MVRLNITLPDDIAREIADKHNKSRFIAEALREKIKREKQKQIEKLLLEGYLATSKEDAKLQDDWGKTEIEEWE